MPMLPDYHDGRGCTIGGTGRSFERRVNCGSCQWTRWKDCSEPQQVRRLTASLNAAKSFQKSMLASPMVLLTNQFHRVPVVSVVVRRSQRPSTG